MKKKLKKTTLNNQLGGKKYIILIDEIPIQFVASSSIFTEKVDTNKKNNNTQPAPK